MGARKAKVLGDFQHRGRISLSESAGIALGCILCHNCWNKRVLWLFSISRTEQTPKEGFTSSASLHSNLPSVPPAPLDNWKQPVMLQSPKQGI